MSAHPPPPADEGPSTAGERHPISAAFDFAWVKLWANFGMVVLGVLTVLGVFGVLAAIGLVISSAGAERGQIDSAWFQVLAPMLVLVGFLLTYVLYAGLIRVALALVDGRPATAATIFRVTPLPPLLLAAFLVGLLVAIGTFLCVVPALVVGFLTQYTPHFLIDRRLGALAAIRASVDFVRAHLRTLLGFYLAALLVLFVGSLLCGLGLVLAMPVVVIASAHIYRALQGAPPGA